MTGLGARHEPFGSPRPIARAWHEHFSDRLAMLALAAGLLVVITVALIGAHMFSSRSAKAPAPESAAVALTLVAPIEIETHEAQGPTHFVATRDLTIGLEPSAASQIRQITPLRAAPADEPLLSDVTNGVLIKLGLRTPPPPEVSDQLRALVAQARGLPEASPRSGPEESFELLVATALKEGRRDEAIDTLVNEAALWGLVRAPSALITSDGRVDTATLLSLLLDEARGAQATHPSTPVHTSAERPAKHLAPIAEGLAEAHRLYTVTAGDSLGAIAHRYYGDADHYMTIYDANRLTLPSPDRIRIGQQLVIPSRERRLHQAPD